MEKLNLYNLEGNSIDIYNLIPNEPKITAYKKRELEFRIPEKDRIYTAATSAFKILEEDLVDEDKLNTVIECFSIKPYFHHFSPATYNEEYKELVEAYYNGQYTNSRVVRIRREDIARRIKIVKYLLMTQDKYEDGSIKGMISIPEKLYLLQMLEQGKYSLIYKEQIDEQLSLFDLTKEPIGNMTLDDLLAWHNREIPHIPFDNTLEQVQTMSLIYKRIKK